MKPLSQTSNIERKESTKNIKNIMQKVLEMAHKEGATSAQTYCNHDVGFSVDVSGGQTETVQFHEDSSISITVFDGYKKGSASSTDLCDKALESMVRYACDIAKISSSDQAFGLADKELMATDIKDLALFYPWDVDPQQAIVQALECERLALLDKRIFKAESVNVSTMSGSHGYANTHGFNEVLSGSRHSISCCLIAKHNDMMQRDYEYSTSRNPDNLASLKIIAKNAIDKTLSRLNARKVKTQKVPVVFSNRVSSGLISSFLNSISGSNLYRKNSFLLNSLGQKIFPEFMNIYEQPYLLGALGSSPYDSEGVQTRNNVFVDKGILNLYVLGSYSARKLGMQTTANSGGVFNLTVDANADSLEQIIAPINKGLVVTELMGQGVNILTGDYSRGASGFWIENGQIAYPVEEITIAGNLKDMFSQISAVGKDVNPNHAIKCGSILIDHMIVAGN